MYRVKRIIVLTIILYLAGFSQQVFAEEEELNLDNYNQELLDDKLTELKDNELDEQSNFELEILENREIDIKTQSESIIETSDDNELHITKAKENQSTKSNDETTVNITSDDLIQLGDKGDRILDIKNKLMKVGFGQHWSVPTDIYDSDAVKVVTEFKSYYGIHPEQEGVIDQRTLKKLEEILSSPYQRGNRSEEIQNIKHQLVRLGFGTHWTNPTTLYGSDTERVVRDFQSKNNLVVNGIIDEVTLAKIEELLESPYKLGLRRADVADLKYDLMEVGFGAHWTNPTTYYGPDTEKEVRKFQEYYGLDVSGIMDSASLDKLEEVLSSPYQRGKRSDNIKEIKEDLMFLGFGTHWTNPTTLYGSDTEKVVREFQDKNNLVVNGIIDEITLAKIEELLESPYKLGLRRADVVDLKYDLMKAGFGTHWTNPTTLYGPDTEREVRKFQDYYGLEVTGVMDSESLTKLEKVLSSPYQRGKRSEEIKELKEILYDLGFGSHWTNPTTLYGPDTVEVVRSFQNYYGLAVNGIIDEITLEKMNERLENALQYPDRNDSVLEFKLNLKRLGFGTHWKNPTTYFGPDTVKVVKQFQEFYGLSVSGIANDKTLDKMNEILSSPMRLGKRSEEIQKMKRNLMKLGFGGHWKNPTTYFGEDTENVVKEFQKYYNLPVSGIADEVTLALIDEIIKKGYIKKTSYNISLDKAVEIQMNLKEYPRTDSNYAWVSKSYIKNNKVTASALNVRKGPGTKYESLGTLTKGTTVKVLDEYNGWYAIQYDHNTWLHANEKDVRYYLDPNNFIDDEKQRFQFLDLSAISGAKAKQLNEYLKDKGILKGKGQAFIDAGRIHGINEIYLISHALLETGNGSSELANGLEVGLNKDGKPKLVTSKNKKQLTKIKTVYNMYGIGAYDGCAKSCGAERAYKEGWTTPEKAIIGGAKFIGNNYIKAGQNTLYKMRWNPDAMVKLGYASHQYATDVGWAFKQVTTMYNLYKSIEIFNLRLDIPVYK